MGGRGDRIEIRRAEPSDHAAVLGLFRQTLGWQDGDPNEDFFAWKHRANPVGPSPEWVATHDGAVVGYRTLLRWRFTDDTGKPVSAFRAVDTATHPEFQGLGIFRRLTLHAVSELTRADEGIIFNTPNTQSGPGYLKMGWQQVGRLLVGVLPSGPRSLRTMLTSRVPAELWSRPTTVGVDAREAFADPSFAEHLLQHAPARGFRTTRTPEYLAWRTAFGPLAYRVLLASPADPAEGGVVFRLRRRGAATEVVIVEQLTPDRRTGAALVARVVRSTGADYAIGLRAGPSAGLLPVPGQGPVLMARALGSGPPPPSSWVLTMGDVELL
ncbi:GNAT family N-acetyltransferase [Knoellia sp. CPCC 206435]|uniref:GNAT family N-acetyltransferase n=1 Tax=Knoellia terrae TaxID=3404797 RepID=UPI003B4389CD